MRTPRVESHPDHHHRFEDHPDAPGYCVGCASMTEAEKRAATEAAALSDEAAANGHQLARSATIEWLDTQIRRCAGESDAIYTDMRRGFESLKMHVERIDGGMYELDFGPNLDRLMRPVVLVRR